MSTLYRLYRPQVFGDVRGQEHVCQTLQKAITTQHIAHAYLFYGPRGTGKTTTARILAKRLNCTGSKDAEPCGQCTTCQAAQANKNIDIIEIDAASNRSIEDIRALKEGSTTIPSLGKYKVYIIDEVHMLTNEAFTALLKTLEEPVAHVIFILATTHLHKVPETILSRCQVYRFRRARPEELRERLQFLAKSENRQITDDALTFIIDRSDGCYRDAESLLGQMLSLHDNEITASDLTNFLGVPSLQHIDSFLTALVDGTSAPALTTVNSVFSEGFDLEQFIKESIIAARNGAVSLASGQQSDQPFTNAKDTASRRLPIIIRALLQALQDLAYVPEPLVAIHLAILTVCNSIGTITQPNNQQNTAAETLASPNPESAPKPNSIAPLPPSSTPGPDITPITATPIPEPQPTLSTPVQNTPSTSLSLKELSQIWPQLIEQVKRVGNPVAATFLRAIEPGSIEDDLVTIYARFGLHRSYFEKPENKALLSKALKNITQKELKIRCVLNDQTGNSIALKNTSNEATPELLNTVKEVFGQKS